MFEGLAEGYRGAEGRMAQELLRRHVLRLLRIWRGWFIFGDDYLNGLQVRGGRGPRGAGGCWPAAWLRVRPVLADWLAR